MNNFIRSFRLALEVSPLIEDNYTGISNVAFEIAIRALYDSRLEIIFFISNLVVPEIVIKKCLENRNGKALREFLSFNQYSDIYNLKINKNIIALYTNTKPINKKFNYESQIIYDLSTFIVPECHTEDTIKYHANGIIDQINSCDILFCISDSTAIDVENIFEVKREKIHVIPLGSNINLQQVQATRKFIETSILGVEPYILILGTIEPRKNISLILNWIKQYPQITNSYRFIFAGRHGWGPSFEDLINSAGLFNEYNSRKISWYGFVDENSKAILLSGASCLIFSSLFEGFGLPVLEAMSAGVIVLSSSSTSMPEILGDCGYYFNPESIKSLQDAFLQFTIDKLEPGVHETLIKKALQRTANFSYDKAYEIIISSLNGLMSQ